MRSPLGQKFKLYRGIGYNLKVFDEPHGEVGGSPIAVSLVIMEGWFGEMCFEPD